MIVAVTGHRPPKLGGYYIPNAVYDAVRAGLLRKFHELQPTVVLTGMALGTDQWAAEICYANGIPFDAIVPFHGFENTWPDASKAQYHRLLTRARNVHTVTNTSTYSSGLLQRRNQWLVDHSAMLLGVWNGSSGGTANCISYARGRSKPIVLVDLPADIWALAAETELALSSVRADRRERARQRDAAQVTPNAGPLFRRRVRLTPHLDVNDITDPGLHSRDTPAVSDEDYLRRVYDQVLHSEPEPPQPTREADRALLMEILGTNPPRAPSTQREPIPSPIKGDKQATPRKTGRIIDLDD